jgi:hypothetical protein
VAVHLEEKSIVKVFLPTYIRVLFFLNRIPVSYILNGVLLAKEAVFTPSF